MDGKIHDITRWICSDLSEHLIHIRLFIILEIPVVGLPITALIVHRLTKLFLLLLLLED